MRRAIAIGLALCLATGACSQRAQEARRLLSDIAAGPDPSRLKAETPVPERHAATFPGGSGDLYVSPEGALGALVLVPGLAATGKDDPRLIAFAHSLARARFAVLVPDIASLRALQVRPGDSVTIAEAAHWLAADSGFAARGRVGVIGISYAAGPAMLATLVPGAGGTIEFVLAVGGYHDIDRMVVFFTTGDYRLDGVWRHLEPNAYGKWVFVASNAGRLDDAADRAILARIADLKLDDPSLDVTRLAASLGPQGLAVLALVDNDDRAATAALIAGLPAGIRHDMAALDPARAPLETANSRFLLIHGRDDSIVPYSESVDLAQRLGPAATSLYLLDGMWHVDSDFSLADQWILWDAAIELLELRDGVR